MNERGRDMPNTLPRWKVVGRVVGVALLSGAAFLTGCGGDGGSASGPAVVAIVITGVPAAPVYPGQSAQLTANATFADGTTRDVTDIATWSTTDPGVVAVSATGSMTAAGPGRADVSATFGGAGHSIAIAVVVLPTAYFLDGIEYAFDYELDAKGRVSSYRITRKPEVDYGGGLGQASTYGECQGDLYGTYDCRWWSANVMRGESGRVVLVSPLGGGVGGGTATYRYGSLGLLGIDSTWTLGTHLNGGGMTSLMYDAQGRLTKVAREDNCRSDGGSRGIRSTASIAVDAQGRLAQADYASETFTLGYPSCTLREPGLLPAGVTGPTVWVYDARGFMVSAGSTTYTVDEGGWLARRREGVGADARIDTYAIVRAGTRVVEESFTQAEPRAFYTTRGMQRVRYEWGRLPSEPLFVPRGLTGSTGADYFGVISSHHR